MIRIYIAIFTLLLALFGGAYGIHKYDAMEQQLELTKSQLNATNEALNRQNAGIVAMQKITQEKEAKSAIIYAKSVDSASKRSENATFLYEKKPPTPATDCSAALDLGNQK